LKKGLKSLSTKLSVFFITSLTIILAIVVSVVSIFTSQAFNNSLQSEVEVALSGMSDTIKGYGVTVQAASSELAKNQDLVSAIAIKNIYTMTSDVMDSVKGNGLSYAFITDVKGNVVAKNNVNDLDLTNFAKLSHVQQALQGKSSLVTEVVSGKNLCICSATPIVDGNKIVGVASAIISLQNSSFLEQLKKLTGCEFTVFLGDERINTTIVKDGKHQTGTKLSSDIAQQVIGKKQTYNGKTNILGSNHMSSYQPILDANKNVIGILFAGKNIAATEQQTNFIIIFSILIALVMVVISTIVLTKFINKIVKTPLSKVVALANNMENGEIGIANKDAVALTIHSEDEVGQVAYALSNTVNSLQTYVGEISTVLSAISAGNLSVQTEHEYYGDFLNIKEALNNIIYSLNHTLFDISKSAELVSARSEQISNGAMAISQGATEQASSTEELSATITEISAQIQKTAENASVASSIAKQSTGEVEKGNHNIEEMLCAMNNINAASMQIGKIIKTIEDIAFQTNILALNAAVEAARAGSAGRGFAVVADEVRNLASKSAEAAKQTAVLIENTVSLVSNGTKIANSTAESFKAIMVSSKKSTDLIAEISKATNTQASAVAQVSVGIEQITQVVQTNSATSEENAAASQDLSMQAQVLQNLVSKFQLNDAAGIAAEEDAPEFVNSEAPDPIVYIDHQNESTNEKYE